MSVRNAVMERESRSIDESQSRAIAARQEEERRPRTALEAMAARLHVSPVDLKNTLVKTVFKGCNTESEFLSLVIVSNEYGLNPLLKEIYAFPVKGGGIQPMVSVDGWIRLMNEHPQFDGIEFDYINNAKGETEAIEAIIYRKDRNHPVKVIEYMTECKRGTDPWNKSPRRMLRHRALMQCTRIAFGFSGVVAEGDEDVIEGQFTQAPVKSLPSNKSFAEELDDGIPDFDQKRGETIDADTGEVTQRDSRGMTVVDEETDRALDARDADDGTFDEQENPTAEEGPTQEQRGEDQVADETPAWAATVEKIKANIKSAKTKAALDQADKVFANHMAALPDEVVAEIEKMVGAQRKAIAAKQGG